MRFIHIADVHLGASPDGGKAYTRQRPRELWDSFTEVIELCERQQIDILLIAGDLFHRQPLLRELKEVDYLFSSLTHTKVVLIAGNHDYIGKDSFYRSFRWSENVFTLFGEKMETVVFPELETAVYGFSYHSREISEPKYEGKKPAGAGQAMRYKILLAHGGDAAHIPIRRETLEQARFCYVALGHIHKPQDVVPQKAAYAGALEPIDKNDTGPHGYIQGETTETGVSYRFVPHAKREYIHLALSLAPEATAGSIRKRIQQVMEEKGTENLYKIVLRGTRDSELFLDLPYLDSYGNILELVDETKPDYDFEKIRRENQENILGKYIESFGFCEEGSVEAQAMYEGVRAFLADSGSRR